jgi:xylose dehydrogenase (NAD/NADP)
MDLDSILARGSHRDWQRLDPTDVEPTRVAVIGLGWFTKERALPALEDSDFCVPSVVVSGSSEKAERIATETEGCETGLTYDAFLDGEATDEYDAIYVVTPNALHLDYVEAAAEFGKAVLCEKPIERSVERAERLVAACEDAGVPLMIAYRMQTEPAVRRARELVEEGAVGEPQAVHGTMSQRLLERINPDPDQWRLDEWLAGGGALFDLGVYPLNTGRFLLDEDPVAVMGRTKSTHEAFDEVDESASFTVAFPEDVHASCFASHNARQASSIAVVGTEGRVEVSPAFFQDQNRSLHVSRGDGRMSVEFDRVDQMREEFDYFAHQVRAGEDLHPDGRHGVVDMRAMEAVYESESTGAWVDL